MKIFDVQFGVAWAQTWELACEDDHGQGHFPFVIPSVDLWRDDGEGLGVDHVPRSMRASYKQCSHADQ